MLPAAKRPKGTAGLTSWSADVEDAADAAVGTLVQDLTLNRLRALEDVVKAQGEEIKFLQEDASMGWNIANNLGEQVMRNQNGALSMTVTTNLCMRDLRARARAAETRLTLIEVRLPLPPSPPSGEEGEEEEELPEGLVIHPPHVVVVPTPEEEDEQPLLADDRGQSPLEEDEEEEEPLDDEEDE